MQTTYVYRHYNGAGVLLYIGIAEDVDKRTGAHRQRSPWAAEIARTAVKPYKTRMKAAIAELQAIDKEKPLYNVVPGMERRRKMVQAVMFSARVPTELVERVTNACKSKKISRSDFVRAALELALDNP